LILSIIIVNYNGKSYLSDCLQSIAAKVSTEHEVIIVDNASSDDSVKYIKDNFPYAKLIINDKNAGFSAGNNLGVSRASGKYVLLLNNDTVILDDVQLAIDLFEFNKGIGVIGCNLLYGDRRLQFSYGYEHTPLRIALSWIGLKKYVFLPSVFRREEMRTSCYGKAQSNVGWVSGAFLMTRKILWDSLGGMDDNYFMYVEDVDFCKRIRKNGYRIFYTPDVKVIHYEGGGKAWIGRNALRNTFQSYMLYVKKHHNKYSEDFVRSVLFMVMMLRSVIYRISFVVTKKNIYEDKYITFFEIGTLLLKGKIL